MGKIKVVIEESTSVDARLLAITAKENRDKLRDEFDTEARILFTALRATLQDSLTKELLVSKQGRTTEEIHQSDGYIRGLVLALSLLP